MIHILPSLRPQQIRHLAPAWLSLLLVPVVTAAALDVDPDEPLRLMGIGVLCAAIMLGQVLVALELHRARQREVDLAQQATTDPLTGLGNRRALDEAMRREARRGERTGRPAALLLLDLDGFKAVNDRYGHHLGDALLQAFATVLARRTRQDLDGIFRLGGDEFVVLMPEADEAGARLAARRIRDAFRPLAARLVPEVPVDCSIGVAQLEEHDNVEGIEGWLATADRRMYAAKGRLVMPAH